MPQLDAHRANAGAPPPGYRLPGETRPGRVMLQVSNLESSLNFYGKLLGFDVRDSGGGHTALTATGGGESLIELRELEGASRVPSSGHLGLYHFAVLLPDRAAFGHLLAHLGRADVRPGMSNHGVSESIYLKDPDGLGLEIYSDRPRSQWRWSGNELHMITAPLDTDDLIRAGGSQPWTGMPIGTRIGHVHLNVGDLKQAAAFYHAGLGLDITVRSYPGALFMSAGGYHHHLAVNTWAAMARRATDTDARLVEWELVLPAHAEVEPAATSLEQAGYRVRAEGACLITADPWGIVLRLTAPR